jgi:hypothetical protein
MEMVELPLIAAGSLALLGAAVHGVAGEIDVVRKLSPGTLPSSSSGSPLVTKMEIHVTWHLATIAFLTVGSALVLSGSVLDGDTAQALALAAAAVLTGFAALAVGLGASYFSLRSLTRHPAPALLTTTAALAWWGALSV